MTHEKRGSEWKAIRNGRGVVTGWIEMFWSASCGWVTIPGVSRYRDAASRAEQD